MSERYNLKRKMKSYIQEREGEKSDAALRETSLNEELFADVVTIQIVLTIVAVLIRGSFIR